MPHWLTVTPVPYFNWSWRDWNCNMLNPYRGKMNIQKSLEVLCFALELLYDIVLRCIMMYYDVYDVL